MFPGSNPDQRVLSSFLPRVCALSLDPPLFLTTTMFPSNSYTNGQSSGGGQEQRPQFQHSHSHPVQFNGSPFTVAGMSNQGAGSPSMRGSSLGMGTSLGMGSPLSESLSQSRSHYQPGYLMVGRHNKFLLYSLTRLLSRSQPVKTV